MQRELSVRQTEGAFYIEKLRMNEKGSLVQRELSAKLTEGAFYIEKLRMNEKGSLVQRELSARLTEGLFYEVVDIRTNAPKVPMYLRIRYSDDR